VAEGFRAVAGAVLRHHARHGTDPTHSTTPTGATAGGTGRRNP
jgi:hypothetical protein